MKLARMLQHYTAQDAAVTPDVPRATLFVINLCALSNAVTVVQARLYTLP